MTKLYVLLSLGKGGDNTFVEGRMSTPLVCYILSGVILLVVLLRVFSWLQYLQHQTQSPETVFLRTKPSKSTGTK